VSGTVFAGPALANRPSACDDVGMTSASTTSSPLVVVGCSLGGFQAMQRILLTLGSEMRAPLLVVQHRSREGDDALVEMLQWSTPLRVSEPDDKEPLRPGRVYVAPADYHLQVEADAVSLSVDAPVVYARPSIDTLFESAARVYGPRAVGVVLTGASRDGARGLAAIKARGGRAIVQDPSTAECGVMIRAAMAACRVDEVLSLEQIGHYLARL
jgi:two-component system chemotaxis response regulator CheB